MDCHIPHLILVFLVGHDPKYDNYRKANLKLQNHKTLPGLQAQFKHVIQEPAVQLFLWLFKKQTLHGVKCDFLPSRAYICCGEN
jgi:hypothetical protein